MEIPDYIEEEINNYTYEKEHNIKKATTLENIEAYIRLAQKVGRITEEEAEKIREIVGKI